MCGIAGYSLDPASSVDGRSRRRRCWPGSPSGAPTRSAMRIAAAIRRSRDPQAALRRDRAARTSCTCPTAATQVLVHVRDYTKGHPTIEANNHPIRHGAVVGIHNGIIVNDDEIFARYGFARARPR